MKGWYNYGKLDMSTFNIIYEFKGKGHTESKYS